MRTITSARILQLYYHNCHHLTSGESFFADHGFFNDSYLQLEEHYDRLSEYFICLFGGKAFETKILINVVNETLSKYEVEEFSCEKMFQVALELETKFYKELESVNKKASIGLANTIGDIAEQADVRMYKIKQRNKKEQEG